MGKKKIAIINRGSADTPHSDDVFNADGRAIEDILSGDFGSESSLEMGKVPNVGAVKDYVNNVASSGGTQKKVEYKIVPTSSNYIELEKIPYNYESVLVFIFHGILQLNALVTPTNSPPNYSFSSVNHPKRLYIKNDVGESISGLSEIASDTEIAIIYEYSI